MGQLVLRKVIHIYRSMILRENLRLPLAHVPYTQGTHAPSKFNSHDALSTQQKKHSKIALLTEYRSACTHTHVHTPVLTHVVSLSCSRASHTHTIWRLASSPTLDTSRANSTDLRVSTISSGIPVWSWVPSDTMCHHQDARL